MLRLLWVFRLRSRTPYRFGCWHEKLSGIIDGKGTELEQAVHTHRTSCRSGWPRGFGELNPTPKSYISVTSVSVDSGPHSYLLCSATVPITMLITQEYVTEPSQYVTHHFRDRPSAASFHYRNRAEIRLFLCVKRTLIQQHFRAGAKAIRCSVI